MSREDFPGEVSLWVEITVKKAKEKIREGKHGRQEQVFTSCGILGKLFDLSEPQFPHLQNGLIIVV